MRNISINLTCTRMSLSLPSLKLRIGEDVNIPSYIVYSLQFFFVYGEGLIIITTLKLFLSFFDADILVKHCNYCKKKNEYSVVY